MKKLQNNFTTPEQSKRLLDIGLPVKSADCYYCIINATIQQGIEVICDSDTFFDINTYLKDFFPCWSVGRLIEICLKCSTLEQRHVRFFCNGDDDEYSLIDYVVTVLESGVITNHMDFSKLD